MASALSKADVAKRLLERPHAKQSSHVDLSDRKKALGLGAGREAALKTAELAKKELALPRRDLLLQVRDAQAAADAICEGLPKLEFTAIDIQCLYDTVQLYMVDVDYETISDGVSAERKLLAVQAKAAFLKGLPAILQNDTQIKEWKAQVAILSRAKE